MSIPVEHVSSPRGTFKEKHVRALRRYTWWSLAGSGVFILLLWQVWYVALAAQSDMPGTGIWTVLMKAAAVVAGCVAMIKLVSARLRLDAPAMQMLPKAPPRWVAIGAVAAVMDAGIAIATGDDRFWYILPVVIGAVTGMYAERHLWKWVVLAMTAAVMLLGVPVMWAVSGPLDAADVPGIAGMGVAAAFLGAVFFAQLWIWDVADDLDYARRVAADLAIADERLRFANDLHDIQGHHLQVISLKSELAARLAERDPHAAAAQMREVHQLALDAQLDTKRIVSGMRQVQLGAEIANATKVLDAADIDSRMLIADDVRPDALPDDASHVLGLVVREAVTNVLRHSHAARTDVHLDLEGETVRLTITNDGLDGEPGNPSGLAALQDRAQEASGTLHWGVDERGFTVTAMVPLRHSIRA